MQDWVASTDFSGFTAGSSDGHPEYRPGLMGRPALLAFMAVLGCGDGSRPPRDEPVQLAAVPGLAGLAAPAFQASWEVDPFIGSGGLGYGFGSAFPGAAAPHGLAKVGPDTKGELGTVGFQHFSGYWYEAVDAPPIPWSFRPGFPATMRLDAVGTGGRGGAGLFCLWLR